MLEVRGITDYESYSQLSGKSRRGESDGAEFRQLLNTGEDGNVPQVVSNAQQAAEDELISDSRTEVVTYDPFGRKASFGNFIGRNLNLAL